MAIERFLYQYKPGPDLPQLVSSEQNRMENMDPPLLFLLDSLIMDSSQSVRAVSSKFELKPTAGDVDFLLKESHEDVICVIFGNTIKSLMELYQFSILDHEVLRKRLNKSFANTPIDGTFRKPSWMESDRETIHLGKRASINVAAKDDPTFAFFFEKPNHLPKDLKRYLDDMDFFGYKDLGKIVEGWKKVAGHVVDAPKPKTTALTVVRTPELNSNVRLQILDILEELKVSTEKGKL